MRLTWCHNRLAIASSRNGDEPVLRTAAEVVPILLQAGVTHLIVLRREPGFMGAVAAVEILGGIACYWNPTDDDGQPKPALWFSSSIHFALHALANPLNKVAVACYEGNNRSPSTALAILLAQGLHYDEAVTMVLKARPGAEIRYAKDALEAVKALGYR